MTIRVEAIYENGVFRPVERVALYDEERVTLIIEPHDDNIDHEYLAQCQADAAKRGNPPAPANFWTMLQTVLFRNDSSFNLEKALEPQQGLLSFAFQED